MIKKNQRVKGSKGVIYLDICRNSIRGKEQCVSEKVLRLDVFLGGGGVVQMVEREMVVDCKGMSLGSCMGSQILEVLIGQYKNFGIYFKQYEKLLENLRQEML